MSLTTCCVRHQETGPLTLSGLSPKSDWVIVLWVGLQCDKENCGFEPVSYLTQLIAVGVAFSLSTQFAQVLS